MKGPVDFMYGGRKSFYIALGGGITLNHFQKLYNCSLVCKLLLSYQLVFCKHSITNLVKTNVYLSHVMSIHIIEENTPIRYFHSLYIFVVENVIEMNIHIFSLSMINLKSIL